MEQLPKFNSENEDLYESLLAVLFFIYLPCFLNQALVLSFILIIIQIIYIVVSEKKAINTFFNIEHTILHVLLLFEPKFKAKSKSETFYRS